MEVVFLVKKTIIKALSLQNLIALDLDPRNLEFYILGTS